MYTDARTWRPEGADWLAGIPNPTGEDGGEAKEEESGGRDGEHGWTRVDRERLHSCNKSKSFAKRLNSGLFKGNSFEVEGI